MIAVFLFLDSSGQKFDSLLQVLDSRYPQEKIYAHYDKSYYNPGETIWLKAYIFSANMPSQISKTVYAELLDDKGKLIERRTAPVIMSSAAAAFDLPPTLKETSVYIRLYTDWMLNFDSSLLYSKVIPVIQETSAAAAAAPKNFLQFFPEGGDLVQTIESRVAFKATDARGLPFAAQGTITNSKGATVANFSPAHDGMGFFVLRPEAGQKYVANWKDAAGRAQQTPLPAVKNDGVVLKLEQDVAGIIFTLSRKEAGSAFTGVVNVVGQMQQQLIYLANGNLANTNVVKGVIPVENLPAGIVQITAFDRGKPLAERIIFVDKPDYYFITDLNTALKSTENRKKNVVQIDVPDTIRTNLSVSVTDADINPALPGEEDIFSNILLTSDIKGYVHNPAYYFSSEADSVLAHRDLVMMTNGWRRFKWEDVIAGKFPSVKQLPADYITIRGKISGLTKTQLINRDLTGILEIDKKQEFISIPVETDGTFAIPGMVFFDTAKLFYQFNNDKEKVLTSRASFDVKSNLFNSRLPFKYDTTEYYRISLPALAVLAKNKDLADKNMAVLDARRKVETLEAVTVTARTKSKKEQMDEQYTSGMFRGGDGQTFIIEDDLAARGAISIIQYLQGRVAGLQISPTGQMTWRGATPTLFLNEVITDPQQIMSIAVPDIAMVKVFRPPFFGAPGGGAGGAVAIYTKRGSANNTDVKGLDFAKIPGYTPMKEFYSPDYSKYDERHSDADYRSTLYWDPFILTDKDSRRILFTFFNNDATRRFRVVIEGFNEEGRLTRIEKIFE